MSRLVPLVVIDVGCATYGGDSSIPHIQTELEPDEIVGFDPSCDDEVVVDGGTTVRTFKAAAWTYDGEIGFVPGTLGGRVEPEAKQTVKCVDLARVIENLSGARLVLKMDAEGAEYVLLPYLIERKVDRHLDFAWVEWHCPVCGNGHWWDEPGCYPDPRRTEIERAIRCRMETWRR